jgi:CheY-like chemotaxis protein
MRTAAERGATLTAQLLAFSRRQRLEARPVDLNDTVIGMRDLLQSSMGGSVRLEARLRPDLWPALVDPTQIELIILNLAINARDAMEVGGSLTVSTDNITLGEPERAEEPPPGDYVLIAVTDTGSGMPPEVRDRAFEPFFTTKPVGKGSGLGLPQVYGFAKQSGGGVAIETKLGDGTSVRVYLPRAQDRRANPRLTGYEMPIEHPGEVRGKRVLVVDDDPPVREITATMLRTMGAVVQEAGSGGAALEMLDAGDFDLLVVDFAMPGMNGAELAATSARKWPDLPILFVTGYADLSAIADVSEDRIVQKPFRGGELQRKIGKLLAGKAS